MKNILYIITLVLIFSCKTQKATQEIIIGTYETKTEGLFGRIMLNKDFSFLYQYNIGLINTTSKGSWKLIDGALILKSDEEYLNNQIQVKEYSDEGKIIIKDPLNNPVVRAHVVLNNEQKALGTDSEGLITIKKDVVSFEIHYLGDIFKYKVVDDTSNSYNITLHLSDLSKTYFDNQSFKVKSKFLVSNEGLKFIKINISKASLSSY